MCVSLLAPVAVTHYLGRFKNKPFFFFPILNVLVYISGKTWLWFHLHASPATNFQHYWILLANPTAGLPARRIRAAAAPPAALRSAVAALISILAQSFRFMSGSLTCFKPAVYWHLLPPPSSCLFALRSLLRLVLCSCRFFFCCSFLGGVRASSTHLSPSFLFSFSSCLDSYSVFKWIKHKSLWLSLVAFFENSPTSSNGYFLFILFLSRLPRGSSCPHRRFLYDVAGILSESNFPQL